MINGLLFILFIFIISLVPGYVLIKKISFLAKHPGTELSLAIGISIVFFALLATAAYLIKVSLYVFLIVGWIVIAASIIEFIRTKLFKDIWANRFPLICWLAVALLAACFFSLPFSGSYSYYPDPTYQSKNNYNTLNVKIINLAHTQANDNYIAYRQAQFFTNRLDPAKTPFISEWDVGFFERTPLMGAFTAGIYTIFHEKTPTNILWFENTRDPDHTYLQYQLITCVLNTAFIVPAFYLLRKLFNKRVAIVTCLFLVISSYFLYDTIFSWPKSLVAFFILLSWILILEKQFKYTVLAGVASGVAYLTHDLAILYIGATLIYLMYQKRFRESVIYILAPVILSIPWLYASIFYYKQPSTFIYYPISTKGIPQVGQTKQLLQNFRQTSLMKLIAIRLQSIGYLFNPTHWSNIIFSIPGALGFGLIAPFFMGIVKSFKNVGLLILIFCPIVIESIVVGWPDGLGALHFAEALLVLCFGVSVNFLLSLKNRLWMYLVFIVNLLQFGGFLIYSYYYHFSQWFASFGSIMRVAFILGISIISGIFIYRVVTNKQIWIVGKAS